MTIKVGKPTAYNPSAATPPAANTTAPVAPPVASTPQSGRPKPPSAQAPAKPTSPVATSTKPLVAKQPTGPGLHDVQVMQQAMIDLALDISESDVASKTPKNKHRELDEQGRYLGGSMPFSKFIVNQYMNQEEQGQQYITAPQTTKQRTELSQKDMDLSGVINTIKTIGSTGKENKPDGVWGPRTTNSIINISKFVSAMLSLAEDMGIKHSSYTKERLDQLFKTLKSEPSKLPASEKSSAAKFVAKELLDIRRSYDEFKRSIMDNPSFKDFIHQEKPFVQHNQSKDTLSPEETSIYDRIKTSPIPNLTLDIDDARIPVSLWDIFSMDNFKKFLAQNNIKDASDAHVQEYIKILSDKLNAPAAKGPYNPVGI